MSFRSLRLLAVVVAFSVASAAPVLACEACVEAYDGQKFCKDPTAYQSYWPRYAGCEAWKYCYHVPGSEDACYWYCDGQPCFEV